MYNDSWHWLSDKRDLKTPGPKVNHTNWGIYEPGIYIDYILKKVKLHGNYILEGGECAVMDSRMGWSWNAVRCVISGIHHIMIFCIFIECHQGMFPARDTLYGVPLHPYQRELKLIS